MSEGCFWRIYFVLLHPKLTKHDALLLSTPQVLEARALLSHELKTRTRTTSLSENSGSTVTEAPMNVEPLSAPVPLKTVTAEETTTHYSLELSPDLETEKHPVEIKEIRVVDKPVIEERPIHHDKPLNPSGVVIDVQVEDETDD